MENPKTSETLGTEDPAGRTQEEASGLGLMVISEQCTRLTSARVVSVEENGKTSAANDNGVRAGNGEVETEMIQLEEGDDCIRGDGLTKVHTGNNCVIGADIDKGYTDNCGVDVLNEVQIDHNVSRLSNKTDAFSFVESQSDTNLLDLSGIGSGAARDNMFPADRTIETELNVDGTEASMVDFDKNLEVTTDGTLSSADTQCYPSRFMQINLDVENRSDLHAIKGNSEQARAEGLEKVSDNQNNRFSVGDIVWAKTKNQKWWPGKIYNPVDAPEHVTKSGPDNFPLVGYFGMTHFAWCCPSQLKAFYDNFEQISATNKARIFLGAVEKAVNEFGRNVQLDMTCSCALRGNQLIAGQLSSIGGVKPVMKASELGEFSFVHFKSAKFLAHIKDLAHVVSMPQLLDFTVTRNRLTAFHRFIGHSQLSMHLLLDKDDMVRVGNRSKRREESLKSTLLSNKPVEVSPKTMKSRAYRLGNVGGVKQGNMENEFESRERKKSRYLCYPFIDMEKTGLPAATEDSKVLKDARDGLDAKSGAAQCKASISNSKCSGQKFWKKWYRTFIRGSGISSNSELLNASSTQLLFELSSAAVDCLYPIENEKFDSVGWFFSRYRISVYQDESISETYMVGKNEVAGAEALSKGEHTSRSPTVVGKNVSGLQDVKGTLDTCFDNNSLTRKKKGRAKIARPKTKSLSGLSDVNINITSSSSSIKDALETVPLFACSKGKQKEGGACAQYLNTNQTIGIPDLNRSSVGPSVLVDDSLISGHVAFEGKSDLPRDVGKQAISRHSNANNSNGLLDVNINYAKPGSLVVDLSVPRTGLLLDFAGNCVHPGLTWQDPKITDLLSAEHKPKQRKRKKKDKAVPEHQTAGIPDLNETGAVEKEFGETTGLSPPVKSKPKKKRRRRQVVPNYPTNVSFGGRLDININYDSVETNGKAIGSALVLNFAQGVPVPSKEYLSSLFSKFGPLNQLDTQLNDPRSARIVFMKGVDAGEAFRSLAQNNPFGANLTNYGLRHLPTDVLEPCPNLCATSVLSVGGEVANRIQRPNPCPNEAPSIEAMRKNLQVMKSMLEQSGDNLPPEVRTKLEGEIKGLLKKVSSMADVSS